jgi:hypothetical protein
VGWRRRVVGLGFLIAADLCLAATPGLAHGPVTPPSGARDQGTPTRSHPPSHHPVLVRHAVARGKAHRSTPPGFHGGPNGVIDSPPLTRPGSPGREAGERAPRGGFIAWYGPVFWPYAYDDLFEYLLWPADDADYDGQFWVDAFAASIDTALRAAAGLSGRPVARPRSLSRSRAGVRGLAGQSREFAEICGRRTPGRTSWPAERVRRTLDPTGAEEVALGAFKAATAAAATVLDNACVNEMPRSAVRRLAAMERRLDALRQALAILRPALDGLYGALNNAQKARLDGIALDPAAATHEADGTVSLCGPSAPQRPALLPDTELTPPQRVALEALSAAIGAAVERLRTACPTPMPWTLPQRLSALETRLGAMLAAVAIQRPALATFAASREPTSHADEIAPTPR